MSSDGYFDDEELDPATLEELDAIEAAHYKSPTRQVVVSTNPVNFSSMSRMPGFATKEPSFYDISLDLDVQELEKLDQFVVDAYEGKAKPIPGPSKPLRTGSMGTVQTTLFGDVLTSSSTNEKPKSKAGFQRTKSASNLFGRQPRKIKRWDHTEFAKSGLKRPSNKGKGKGKAEYDNEEGDEEEVEFEQFPAPFVSIGYVFFLYAEYCQAQPLHFPVHAYRPPPPMKLTPDLLEAKHWIYPLNQPKRDYQFNIVKHCLFDNTIVALPTGLGKTFIAGVVMLNFYRWYPEGKVVFVAPTKPLVAQQIDACHKTCGIPGSDATELTGQVPSAIRATHWKAKRVFYMTPQTLLNDLLKENCDPRDIILLVVDEAHRATGDYAYNQVVRYLMAKNPHFRLLALTATPGNNPDAVQTLVDGLHISRIEIRDESSLDLRAFVHKKTIQQHIIPMSEDINAVKDLLTKLMDSYMKELRQKDILKPWDHAGTIHPFRLQALSGELKPYQQWARSSLSKLQMLARAMGYLIEGTVGMCHTYLKEVAVEKENHGGDNEAKKKAKGKQLWNNPLFQDALRQLERHHACGFPVHPKMDRLKALVVQHFGEKLAYEGEEPENGSNATRVMVFVTFREAVDEIVEALNFERPLIRAHKFIGQGTDKRGGRGLAQSEQQNIIKRFKAGEFNVLVATSIGEEGLDIGEVDQIVCYDAQKTPIRMLQRSGRTGRKRAGVVHVLLSEGREEQNFEKAKATYKEVQKTILRGEQLELYEDVERLLPEYIKPMCLEKEMEIREYVREDGRKKSTSNKHGSPVKRVKRKRNDDVMRNIPTGASTSFVSVAQLIKKSVQKKKIEYALKDFDEAGVDDETDEEIESGRILEPVRRTKSANEAKSDKTATKPKLRKARTSGGTKARVKGKQKLELPTSQFSQKGIDDDDDMEIERGFVALSPKSKSRLQNHSISPAVSYQYPHRLEAMDISNLSNSIFSPAHPQSDRLSSANQNMAWLVDDDDEPDIQIIDSSPINSQTRYLPAEDDDNVEVSEPIPVLDMSNASRFDQTEAESFESPGKSTPKPSSPLWVLSSSPLRENDPEGRTKMPPPQLPQQVIDPSLADANTPEASFPVRPLGKRRIILEEPESPCDSALPSRRRLKRHNDLTHTQNPRRLKKPRPTIFGSDVNPLFDIAAEHSGDEVSEGSSNSDNDVESESDKLFLKNSPITQVSQSYNQTLVYRQSLFTQVPGNQAPVFAKRPTRVGQFGARSSSGTRGRRRQIVSSSPPPPHEELDSYDFGTFVVDDDEEIIYTGDSSEL